MDARSINRDGPISPGLAAGASSFVLLTALFLYTMHLHYQAIDWSYLGFALVRIVLISTGVAVLSFLLGRRTSWRWPVFAMLGSVAGLAGGVLYVQLAAV